MYKIGIMQGRLTPRKEGDKFQQFPIENWELEFELAANLGFDYIEWVQDYAGYIDDSRAKRILEITKNTGVSVRALCYDNFDYRYQNISGEISFENIIPSLAQVGIETITLPCLEHNSLHNWGDVEKLANFLDRIRWVCTRYNIKICLELDVNYNCYKILKELTKQELLVTFDTGNYFHYKFPVEEIELYNIGHIHIKDRNERGESVLIGQGQTKFKEFFRGLHTSRSNNTQLITLQGARSLAHHDLAIVGELNIVKTQLETLKGYLNET